MLSYIFTLLFSLQAFALHADLMQIDEKTYNVKLDVKYATKDNFTQKVLYKTPTVYLHKDAAKSLKVASEVAGKLGYKIKIFDGFRPIDIQQTMWNLVKDPQYVSNPAGPCYHCRATTLDLTLIDASGKELDMGTEFDSFTTKSHIDSKEISGKQLRNRILLAGIMSVAGFEGIRTEWWHFQLKNWRKYKKLSEQEAGIKLKNI